MSAAELAALELGAPVAYPVEFVATGVEAYRFGTLVGRGRNWARVATATSPRPVDVHASRLVRRGGAR